VTEGRVTEGRLTRAALVEAVADAADLPKTRAELIIETVLGSIVAALNRNGMDAPPQGDRR